MNSITILLQCNEAKGQLNMQPLIAVIIATKNRSEAIEKYALPSLERSDFRDFVCIVWDASDDEATKNVIAQERWSFVDYHRALRPGSASQRNDAAEYALQAYPSAGYFLFIDDDSELSHDALDGLTFSFEKDEQVYGINVVNVPDIETKVNVTGNLRVVTPYLRNKFSCPEPFGVDIEWIAGCSMAVRAEVFSKLGLRFPEAFQRFGGYALGEDLALSFFLYKKLKKKLANSSFGTVCHYVASGGRLNVKNWIASKWYNFHLLFDAIYDDVKGVRLLWLKIKFKIFMSLLAFKIFIRNISAGFTPVFKGIYEAKQALAEYYDTNDIKYLIVRKNESINK